MPATLDASAPPDSNPVETTVPVPAASDPLPPDSVPPDSAPVRVAVPVPDASEATVEPTEPAPPTTVDDGGLFITPFGLPALAKFASVAEVSSGESFDYTFVVSCSGLEDACVNAVMTTSC